MKDLETQWLYEESIAQIHGWDFSHIEERYQEEDDLPWDYKTLVQKYVRPEDRLLDIDTGGGEFLRSIGHSYELTSVTEGYAPNLELCRETLSPLGIDVREWQEGEPLPFADGSMDIILNRHGSFEVREIQRVLRPGGIFLTQQVGEDNDRELVELLLPGVEKPYPGWNLRNCRKAFEKAGFQILEQGEAMRPIRFFDVGALVWFAHVISWEFPGFSVERCRKELYRAQEILEKKGEIEGRIHRFMLVMRK